MESRADNRLLNFPKVRGAQTEPISVFLDGSTGRYKMISGGDDAKTKTLGDRILAFLQKSPYNRYEQDEISEALGIPLANRDSVYQALGRLFKRGLITKRPSKNGGKRKVYGVANPSQLAHAEGLRSATVTQDNKSQDTHPPLPVKVSDQNAGTVTVQQVELTDSLTDTSNNLTDTKLTPQNDVKENNSSNIDSEAISEKLTDTDTQGSVCPELVTVTQETVTQSVNPTEDQMLKAGDMVFWSECPAHCSSLAPFQVMSIDDGYAKLDLVEKPVPLTELSRA
jgi:DNA-binding PadR family transcriptional regulator